MKKAWLFYFLFLATIPLWAQSVVDTFRLQAVEIKASRLEKFGLGQPRNDYSPENLTLQNARQLDDLLAGQSSVFIKSYGAGSLASPASRGTGFGHSAVLWNGFNLQSPLNGGIDFSLLPLLVADEVKVQQGGSSALFGSGAIGATIHLDQKAQYAEGGHGSVQTHGGSFGHLGQKGQLSWGKGKYLGDVRVQHDQAQNDFWVGKGDDRRRQVNAQLEDWVLTQHNQFQLATNQLLKTWFWGQITDRQLPPNIFQNNVHEIQRDSSFRFGLEWQRYGNKSIQKIRTAWLDSRLEYASDLISSSYTTSKSLISELENEWQLGDDRYLLVGFNYTYDSGSAPGIFSRVRTRQRLATFGAYRQAIAQWKYALNFRQEWAVGLASPSTGSLGFESPKWGAWQMLGQVSRNYKLPTFNDLYWLGAGSRGNPDLKAEKSWSSELTLSYEYPMNKHSWTSRLTAFNINVNDWIIWIPQEGVWQPDNLRKVWSRGVEVSSDLQMDWTAFQWSAKLLYQWNRATNQKVYAGALNALGRQLIHVPIHSARAQLEWTYGQSQLAYRHQYNGNRFTSSDNENSIAAYQLGDLIVQHRFSWAQKKLILQGRIENLWNADYEVLSLRPMPGRAFWGALTFEF